MCGGVLWNVCGWFAIRFFVVYLEVLTIAKLDHQLNEEIRDKEIRLIGADGAQLGIMSSAQANAMAEEQGLDLVKISPNASIWLSFTVTTFWPVMKIIFT